MEYIEKEEQEVRRKSSVNERALSLAQKHRRYSVMEEHEQERRASQVADPSYMEEKELERGHKENV